MKPIDFELERARRALDGPEAYPGELIEAVIVGLVGDMQRPGVETPEARAELVNLCQRITARVAERERCPASPDGPETLKPLSSNPPLVVELPSRRET